MTLYRIDRTETDGGPIEGYLSDMVGVLIDEGILVVVEPTGRECTEHYGVMVFATDLDCVWRQQIATPCVMVDVVRVTP